MRATLSLERGGCKNRYVRRFHCTTLLRMAAATRTRRQSNVLNKTLQISAYSLFSKVKSGVKVRSEMKSECFQLIAPEARTADRKGSNVRKMFLNGVKRVGSCACSSVCAIARLSLGQGVVLPPAIDAINPAWSCSPTRKMISRTRRTSSTKSWRGTSIRQTSVGWRWMAVDDGGLEVPKPETWPPMDYEGLCVVLFHTNYVANDGTQMWVPMYGFGLRSVPYAVIDVFFCYTWLIIICGF